MFLTGKLVLKSKILKFENIFNAPKLPNIIVLLSLLLSIMKIPTLIYSREE
jgi:hypothetical protein